MCQKEQNVRLLELSLGFSKRVSAAALVCLSAGVNLPATAQDPVRVGAEFQVAGYTTVQKGAAAVAINEAGDFVVVWRDGISAGTDTSSFSIQGRRFTSRAVPIGSQFQVNTYTTGPQDGPSVSMSPTGDFVVVWTSGLHSAPRTIRGQRYASDGTSLGTEFTVNTYTASDAFGGRVSLDVAGNYVVVWRSAPVPGDTDTSSFHVRGRRFDWNGYGLASEFQVNTYTTSSQGNGHVVMNAIGDFVVVWDSMGSNATDWSYYSVHAQRYALDGAPLGSEFQVNTYTTFDQRPSSVSMNEEGDFIVVYASTPGPYSQAYSWKVHGQSFTYDGTPQGSEFQVNTDTSTSDRGASVSMEAAGNFIVSWAESSDGGHLVHGQRYGSKGSLLGSQFQVNSYTSYLDGFPASSIDRAGDLVVVWRRALPGAGDTIVGQLYAVPLFGDGFELGGTSAWSGTVP